METIASIEIKTIGRHFGVIHLAGEVDVNRLSELEKAVTPLLNQATVKILILDCDGLEFIDSKVVGYIAYLHTTLSKSQRQLAVAHVNETINDILTLVGLNAIIPFYDSVEVAIETLKPKL